MDKLNRDLLVAVLALLKEDAPRDGVTAAFNIWAKDRDQSLPDLLKQEAAIDDDDLRALETLAASHLRMEEIGQPDPPEAWPAAGPTLEPPSEIQEDALRTTLCTTIGGGSTLPLNSATDGKLEPPGAGEAPTLTPGGRFQLVRPHAKGGIGQVWVARDGELQRDVALKVIQPRYAEREDQRARFLLEAEITGNLEHPGIVPVYSLGRNSEGRPYYAMRFIRGESLAVAIKRFHHDWAEQTAAGGKGKRSKWGIEFRQLLGRFLDVCDAMDYAHNRGVLHRDLKPANIMLGQYGETLVVDWGLAKVIGKNDIVPLEPDSELEPSLSGTTTAVNGETLQGTTIGTPAYMSPEQASGAIDQLGPASDVYSMGATLYELLTGQVAYPGNQPAQVIAKVVTGNFPAPRSIDRSIAAPLEAITLKAMAREAANRYASVREMARDLEHWLADEPVSAYPERGPERLGRLLRQHRNWTYAGAAGLIGVTVVATVAAFVIDAARRREELVRKEAEASFIMAQTAVDDYLTNVSENKLLKEQDELDNRGLRSELLADALKYYQKFVNQRTNDPTVRRQLANAYSRVGAITLEIGKTDQAIAAFKAALAIWERLAAAAPGDEEVQGRLGECHLALGKAQRKSGDRPAAAESLETARTFFGKLVQSHPTSAPHLTFLVTCYVEIGKVQGDLQHFKQGIAALEKAKSVQQQLISKSPDEPGPEQRMAEIINVMGYVYNRGGNDGAALLAFEQVKQICKSLLDRVTAGPKPVSLLDLEALAHYNIGTIYLRQKETKQALGSFEQSLACQSALVAAHPSVTKFQEKLGLSHAEIADLLYKAGHPDEAMVAIRKSIPILEKLVRSDPDTAVYHADLGRSVNTLGYFLDEAGNNREALPEFEKAVAQQRLAVAGSPDEADYKRYLANALENLGEQYVDFNRVGEGLSHYEKAIDLRRDISASHPDKPEYARELVRALNLLGKLERRAGNPSGALESFNEAGALLEPLAATSPEPASRLAEIETQAAAALADQNQLQTAVALLEQAATRLRPAVQSDSFDRETRRRHSETLWELARVFRELHRPADADKIDLERRDLWKDQPAPELAEFALVSTTERAALIGYGKAPVSPAAERVRQLDLDQAAANLKMAIDLGFTDIESLRTKRAAPLLLDRGDMKTMVKERARRAGATQPKP